jgi:hypothetical protein
MLSLLYSILDLVETDAQPDGLACCWIVTRPGPVGRERTRTAPALTNSFSRVEGLTSDPPAVRRAAALSEVVRGDFDIGGFGQLGEFTPCDTATQKDVNEWLEPLMSGAENLIGGGKRHMWGNLAQIRSPLSPLLRN